MQNKFSETPIVRDCWFCAVYEEYRRRDGGDDLAVVGGSAEKDETFNSIEDKAFLVLEWMILGRLMVENFISLTSPE